MRTGQERQAGAPTSRPSWLAEADRDLAFHDDLTGLFNRRLLTLLLARGWDDLVGRYGRVSFLVIDLDHFKEVNDTYGHPRGDDVLRGTADVLKKTFRADDLIVRYGGDEFLVVLPGVGAAEAGGLGVRARVALAARTFTAQDDSAGLMVPVSFSIGAATYPEDGETGEAALHEADRRMFEEKRERRPAARPTPRGKAVFVAWSLLLAGALGGGLLLAMRSAAEPEIELAAPAPVRRDTDREARLLAQIEELKRELAERQVSNVSPAAPTAEERRQLAALRARLQELEAQAAAAAPGPRAPEPVTQPTAAIEAAALVAAPVPTPEPTAPVATIEVRPVLLTHARPLYPEMARQLGREAAVELRVLVDEAGKVARVQPAGPPAGFGFDDAAVRAASSAIFKPATRDGRPVAMETVITIRFSLAER